MVEFDGYGLRSGARSVGVVVGGWGKVARGVSLETRDGLLSRLTLMTGVGRRQGLLH